MSNRDRFLMAARCEPTDRPPVWLMRQAGRCLPEYRALKERHSFLELVQTPDLAVEVTLQPIRRFGFDAAILFSDILIVAEALGQHYHFREAGGIGMDFAVRSAADVDRLDESAIEERLGYVWEALRLLRRELDGNTALIGFAGSPWTLANFMIEGGSVPAWGNALTMVREEPALYARLAEKLTRAVTRLLQLQIEAGAEVVQVFDTLGGIAGEEQFEAASGRWLREIVSGLSGRAPVIVFAKGVHHAWSDLAATGANVLGVDHGIGLAEVAAQVPAGVALQGNLDPALLLTTPDEVRAGVRRVIDLLKGRPGHIFNLGHGVPPEAKLENLAALVETVRATA
jgi:uroporphyrinogen decarboxylase